MNDIVSLEVAIFSTVVGLQSLNCRKGAVLSALWLPYARSFTLPFHVLLFIHLTGNAIHYEKFLHLRD